MEKNFIKVRSVMDVVISGTLTIAGFVLITVPTSDPVNILGFIMIFTGVILFLLLRSGYKDEVSGIRYCKTEHFFSQKEREQIADGLESKPASISTSAEDKGSSLRLDVYHSKVTGKAYMQLFEYIPYKYEPCSRQYEYSISETGKLI